MKEFSAVQKLQQFTADASHELRNPLMAIKSNAAVALKYAEGIRESDVEKFQAIAQNIAQNHGGSIAVTSQLGAGSCFTVRLPVDAERVSQATH